MQPVVGVFQPMLAAALQAAHPPEGGVFKKARMQGAGRQRRKASASHDLYLYSQAATLSYLTRRYDASDPNLTLPAAPSS